MGDQRTPEEPGRRTEYEDRELPAPLPHLQDAVYIKNRAGQFLYANLGMARILNAHQPEDLLGRTEADFYPPGIAEALQAEDHELMCSGKALLGRQEKRIDGDGRELLVAITKLPFRDEEGKVVGLVGIARDANREVHPEERLGRPAEFESVGRLAGGIAHDFNNLLTAISGHLQLALMDLKKDRSPVVRLEQALKTVENAAVLSQQLLAVSRKTGH